MTSRRGAGPRSKVIDVTVDGVPMRVCAVCRDTKALHEYYRCDSRVLGRDVVCKRCRVECRAKATPRSACPRRDPRTKGTRLTNTVTSDASREPRRFACQHCCDLPSRDCDHCGRVAVQEQLARPTGWERHGDGMERAT